MVRGSGFENLTQDLRLLISGSNPRPSSKSIGKAETLFKQYA